MPAGEVVLRYASGNVVAIDGAVLGLANMLRRVNVLDGRHGIGHSDIVENRYMGMKSRGLRDAPAALSCWRPTGR